MIELSVEVGLTSFPLRVEAQLGDGATAVMGPSGAGKTSLLETIAGLRDAKGRIVLSGEVVLDTERGIRVPPEGRRTGYVPQDAGLFPHLRAGENVAFGARGDRRRVRQAIEALEIGPLEHRWPRTLSGGERQRVALARALATEPRVLLLDEPLASLDIELKERVLPYLVRVRDEWGVPMLWVTHSLGEALALSSEVLLLERGALVAQVPPRDLLNRSRGDGELENLLPGTVRSHDASGGITRVGLEGGLELSVPLAEGRSEGAKVLVAIRAEDILVSTQRPTFLSARNLIPSTIVGLETVGHDALLECSGEASKTRWLVRLTPAAVSILGLREGVGVYLAVKSHSVRLL